MIKTVNFSSQIDQDYQLLNVIQLANKWIESLSKINQNTTEFNKIYLKNYKLISVTIKSILNNNEINLYRKLKLEEKSNEIKLKINRLKNERNCNHTRSLICVVQQSCGYLCQLHFLTVCFIQAYYSDRTVIFKDLDPKTTVRHSSHIKFGPHINRFEQSYEKFGQCPSVENDIYDVTDRRNLNCNSKTIRLTIERNYFGFHDKNTDYYPDKFIEDLNQINNYINDPFAWMFGQFINHALVMNNETLNFVYKSIAEKKLQKPYIG